jgi:hypothetical protein
LQKRLIWILLFAALLLYLPCQQILAQEEEPEEEQPLIIYSLGQQSISLSAGLFIPLGIQSVATGDFYESRNPKLGGAGSLQWGIHLSNNWMVGVEVGGMFGKTIQENVLYMLPITVKGSYILHFFPFEIPMYLGTGFTILDYEEQNHINWIIKPGFSSIWKYNLSWGFGLNFVYWWILQPWKDKSKATMGHFLEITAMAQYNF